VSLEPNFNTRLRATLSAAIGNVRPFSPN